MAGVAGTILAAYAAMGIRIDYLLAAAFMSAPGGILMAKIIMPDRPEDLQVEDFVTAVEYEDEKPANIIMAAAMGAQTGVKLAVAVGAMVLAFVALVALANGILGGVGGWFGQPDLSFQQILGTVFAPIMYLIGVPWGEAQAAGGLFGTKIVLNEFVAFIELGQEQASLSPLTVAIGTFALVRVRQFQLDRDPDGGDRRTCSQPAADDREAGAESTGGRQPRKPDERGFGGIADYTRRGAGRAGGKSAGSGGGASRSKGTGRAAGSAGWG